MVVISSMFSIDSWQFVLGMRRWVCKNKICVGCGDLVITICPNKINTWWRISHDDGVYEFKSDIFDCNAYRIGGWFETILTTMYCDTSGSGWHTCSLGIGGWFEAILTTMYCDTSGSGWHTCSPGIGGWFEAILNTLYCDGSGSGWHTCSLGYRVNSWWNQLESTSPVDTPASWRLHQTTLSLVPSIKLPQYTISSHHTRTHTNPLNACTHTNVADIFKIEMRLSSFSLF